MVFDGIGTQTRAESEMLFFAGECDAVTADYAELASAIIKHANVPEDFTVLPGHIEEEPLAPLLRKGDDELHAIVSWAIYALIKTKRDCYDYGFIQGLRDAAAAGKRYRDFNREQQAQILQDYYILLARGADVAAYEPFIAQLRTGEL